MSDLSRLNELKRQLNELEKLKEQIETAMGKVSDYSISSDNTDAMSNACSTFNYVANNMDNYWDVTDSYVRSSVQERLKKVEKEFSSSGTINSCISAVMGKAQEKLNEIDNEIKSLEAQIAALESELMN